MPDTSPSIAQSADCNQVLPRLSVSVTGKVYGSLLEGLFLHEQLAKMVIIMFRRYRMQTLSLLSVSPSVY